MKWFFFRLTSEKNSENQKKADPQRHRFGDVYFLPVFILKFMKKLTASGSNPWCWHSSSWCGHLENIWHLLLKSSLIIHLGQVAATGSRVFSLERIQWQSEWSVTLGALPVCSLELVLNSLNLIIVWCLITTILGLIIILRSFVVSIIGSFIDFSRLEFSDGIKKWKLDHV